MKVSREFKIGVVVLLGISAFVIGINYLKGINVFDSSRKFYVVYNNVGGLTPSSPVSVSGYQVGHVRSIELLTDSPGKVLVTLSISNDSFQFSRDSQARIQSSDLLGTKVITLIFGDDEVMALSGDTLIGQIEADLKQQVNEQILPLKTKAEELISSIDSAVTIVKGIFDENARQNLSASFESIKRSFATLENTSFQLDTLLTSEKVKLAKILSNVESISSNLAANNENMTTIIENFANISDSLAKSDIVATITAAKESMEQTSEILRKISNGEGSMGQLINDEKLYQSLSSASAEIDNLLEDIRLHPNRYVHFSLFGRKEKTLKLTRNEIKQLEEHLQIGTDSNKQEP